jgi:BirA family biotin operon repressor/biotin-[acetyl-CoA-carboxylase] ligase
LPQQPVQCPLGTPFIELQSVDSTNNYALQRIHAGLAQHGEAFFALEQLAGKGQRGKIWTAGKGENIILSVIAQPIGLALGNQFRLVAAVSVAVQRFFNKYAGEETKIKWPNDLYWQDRKAGGILIESVIRSEGEGNAQSPAWNWAVIGVGININQVQFPPEIGNAVSLRQITGRQFDVTALARELCVYLEAEFQCLNSQKFTDIHDRYLHSLYKMGQLVKFRKETRVFQARVKNVTEEGRLVIEHSFEESYDFGEIEWVF